MRVTSIHKDPLTRQIQEGVSIVAGKTHKRDSELSHLLLNSKTEYLQGVVPQTRTTRGSIGWSVINQLLTNNCIFESSFWRLFIIIKYFYASRNEMLNPQNTSPKYENLWKSCV